MNLMKQWSKIYCKKCKTELTFTNITVLKDLDFTKIGTYCTDCVVHIEEKLKNDRFVEEYKGNKIYCKDEKYYPYWQSPYYFKSSENARLRIDNSHVGIYYDGEF